MTTVDRTELRSKDDEVRRAACQRLAADPIRAHEVLIELVLACADDRDESVREWASAALEGVERPEPAQLARLIEIVSADNDSAYWAVTLIGRAGTQANFHQAALCRCLGESTYQPLRQRAAWALGKIGELSAESRETLREAASSDDSRLSRLARRALGE